jgi:hypothetical protein
MIATLNFIGLLELSLKKLFHSKVIFISRLFPLEKIQLCSYTQ